MPSIIKQVKASTSHFKGRNNDSNEVKNGRPFANDYNDYILSSQYIRLDGNTITADAAVEHQHKSPAIDRGSESQSASGHRRIDRNK